MILSSLFVLTCLIGMLGGKEAGHAESQGGTVSAASLPVMCFIYGEKRINPVYGYTGEVSGADDQIVYPLPEDGPEITVCLIDGAELVRSVSYELRGEDGRLISRGDVMSFEGQRGDQRFTVRFEDILTRDEYYHLSFLVSAGRQQGYYYTRVIRLSDPVPLTSLLQYGQTMHDDLFQRDSARKYAAQLETDTKSEKDSLALVTINGNFDQLVWGSSGARQISETWLTIEAIQSNYAYLSFSYLAQADFAEGQPVRFRVLEAMTLQYSESTIYILKYDRHTEQLWSFEDNTISTGAGILLGVQEQSSLQRQSSPNDKFTAFTVAGELFCYDAEEQELTKVFSFRRNGENELRTLQREYSIRILEVGNDGRIEFIVNGYMNGGEREGNCGLSYCNYSPKDRTVTEHISLSSAQSAGRLLEEMNRLLAKGNDHFLYFAFDREVLVMDISTGETAVLVPPAEYPGLVINDEGTVFAWASGADQKLPSSIRIVNLETGRRETLSAEEGMFLQPLGYIQEDLVVGYGSRSDLPVFDGLENRYAFQRFVILDAALKPLHTYEFEDVCIDRIEISTEKMTIHRFGRGTDGEYLYMPTDIMLRNDGEAAETRGFSDYPHESLKKLTVLSYARLPSSLRITRQTAEVFIPGRSVSLPAAEDDDTGRHYYAYGRGDFLGMRYQPGEAISLAGAEYGYVLDDDGELIWCWSPRGEVKSLTPSPNPLKDPEKIGNLTGANFRQLVYYLNEGIPVYWIAPEQQPLWLIGYDWDRVSLFDPQNGTNSQMDLTELDAMIGRDNNYLWYSKE
ncbi:MAG: hypothetical protein J5496_05805 [Lachnospiraceae bacterium]|nr:hypothetical protein [Lachnospiraceae bacterium]